MKKAAKWFVTVVAMTGGLIAADSAMADTEVVSFKNLAPDNVYGSWSEPSAEIVSGPTNYVVTATGYGSGVINLDSSAITGTGNTTLQVTATLNGKPAAAGQLGPIVELVDADGTDCVFAWYGQTLGRHVFTKLLSSPTRVVAAGETKGLDLDALTHCHLQLDPSHYTNASYTISWESVKLVGGSKSASSTTPPDDAPKASAKTGTGQDSSPSP
jgi:hypothetical protein